MHYSPTVRNAKINLQNNTHNITSTTHPNLSFYLRETYRICNFLANCCDYTRKQYKAPISLSPEVNETSSKTGSLIRILYLLTRPIVLCCGVEPAMTRNHNMYNKKVGRNPSGDEIANVNCFTTTSYMQRH